MRAEKIVWCKVKSGRCPHIIDGQCFADELHLEMAEESIGFHCGTLLEVVLSRVQESTPKAIDE